MLKKARYFRPGHAVKCVRAGLFMACLASVSAVMAGGSSCYGTTGDGRLENGAELPAGGANFVAYGSIPRLAGRTYVHSKVKDVIVGAYRVLEKTDPDKVYKYGETGFREGGEFKPHKTHRNGLSADFIVPVLDAEGTSVHLPTHAFNRYGYDIDFDAEGRFEGYRIDYEALAAHIVALHKTAEQNSIGIWRVLFDPRLQPALYRTSHGEYIREHIEIPDKRSWVRHDDHYHVDFLVECKPM